MRKKFFSLLLFSIHFLASAEETIKLEKSNINAVGIDKPIVRENKNVHIITQEKIREKKYRNVEEVLRDAPGITVQSTAFGPVIDMRGSGNRALSRVKVMVDGVSINPNEEAMASVPINSIPVEAIRKIEIIPGGGSTLYGSGSMGGVISISTNSNATKNNYFLDLNYGSYDNRSIGFAGGQNLNKKLYINYGFSYTNSEAYRIGESKDEKSIIGGFDYKLSPQDRIRFQVRASKNIHDGTTELYKSDLAFNRRGMGLNLDTEIKNNSQMLDYEHRFNDKFTFLATLYKQEEERKLNTESIDDVFIHIYGLGATALEYNFYNVHSHMFATFNETKKGAKLRGKYDYAKGELVIGYDYLKANMKRDSDVSSDVLKTYVDQYGTISPLNRDSSAVTNKININMTKEIHGIYAFNKFNVTDKFNITTGLRGEFTNFQGIRKNGPNKVPGITSKENIIKTDRSMENYSGEVGALYKYSDLGNIYVRYERSFVSPFPSQLTDKVPDTDLVRKNQAGTAIGKEEEKKIKKPVANIASIYEDNNLKAETVDTFELGIRDYIFGTFLSASAFMTDTKDEIVLLESGVTNPAIKRWQYKNIGKTRRMGFEIGAEQKFGNLSLSQSFTYVDAKVKEGNTKANIKSGDRVPLTPKTKFTLGIKYDFTERFSLGLTYVYTGEKEIKEMTAKDESIKYRVPSYGIIDAVATYKTDAYSTFRVGAKNLTGKKYNLRESTYQALPAAERSFYMGFTAKF